MLATASTLVIKQMYIIHLVDHTVAKAYLFLRQTLRNLSSPQKDEDQAVQPCRLYQVSLFPEAVVLPKQRRSNTFYTY